MLHSMTDEELLKVCTFEKPESEFSPADHLVVELTKRLEICLEEVENLKNLKINHDELLISYDELKTRYNNNVLLEEDKI